MIPFAILSGKIKTKAGEKEIRILELSPDYFTFRLLTKQAKRYAQSLTEEGQQGSIELSFFQPEEKCYHELTLNCKTDIRKVELFSMREILEESEEFSGETKEFSENSEEKKVVAHDGKVSMANSPIFLGLRVLVNNEEYEQYTRKLNHDYMNYVYLKLEETDAGVSLALTGYPAEKEQIYSENLTEQRAVWDCMKAEKHMDACNHIKAEKHMNGCNRIKAEKYMNTCKCIDESVTLYSIEKEQHKYTFSLGIELDNPAWYRAYLTYSLDEFTALYWDSGNIPIGHELRSQRLQFLYIGNEYCTHLFPKEDQLYALLEKTLEEHLCPVIVFAPVEEKNIIKIEKTIDRLADWCSRNKIKIELVLNDWGMAGIISSKYPNQFHLTLGCLLSKQHRDTRMNYKNRNLNQGKRIDVNRGKRINVDQKIKAVINKETKTCINQKTKAVINKGTDVLINQQKDILAQGPLQTVFYQNYLREHFYITRVSLQSCGYQQRLSLVNSGSLSANGIGVTLHFPFFQMNTSGWCPLIATLKHGNRARQTAVESCTFECMNYAFEYPDFLHMTGRYNSIFGYDDSIINELPHEEGVRLVAGFLNTPVKNQNAVGIRTDNLGKEKDT